ncbi:hypothetical protein GGR22_000722 [Flavobacterium gossypii]|uniref:Uncharacterized protein n=1 Tax=Flavobacterium gossypii TaxID=1646119 RepID=A0ABR6DLP1_9FLAO|nr:hypothetical protein [Flavobacterium gossypii]MBA9072596.1 hypothetical protein [Flavobacterium gossypii]
MVAIIIIALVIAVWWFKTSASEAKQDLVNEKSKIANFSELISLLKNSESGFTEHKLNTLQVCIFKNFDSSLKKSFIITSSNGVLTINFFIQASYLKEVKTFHFTIYDQPKVISNIVISQSHIHEREFFEKHNLTNPFITQS